MESLEASEELLNKFDVEHLVVEAMLFQTGYLTISSHERLAARNVYTLTYANLEVKSALTNYILDTYSPNPAAKERHQGMLYKALLRGDLSKIGEIMYNHFAMIMAVLKERGYVEGYRYLNRPI